ncbi:sulfatase family protein [Mariniblastus fucicola]|uniref:Choline-sulfatase n=1 Tax=Mariniblastus fucicola TaxID=980251 RepID=A0A5B9P9B7_9BACT|nr:sulfatase [Mariniblastus fucicola]QEG21522.1 Choline-sulfatase [Mariniblastus fucicola]
MKKHLLVTLLVFAAVGTCLWSFGIGAGPKLASSIPFLSSTPVEILPPDPRPNIILINLDDADHTLLSDEMLQLYPGFNELAKRSVSFTNLHVTTPFCGPSRAALFRGQYAHRTGVRVNIPESPLSLKFRGGYTEFQRQGHDHDELGVWLKRGGYRTMMLGKYHHNGFDFKKPDGYDDFYVSNGGRYQGTYVFTTRESPEGAPRRNGLDVYRTDQESDDAIALIRQHATRRKLQTNSGEVAQPFFFYYAPLAPHRPSGLDFSKMVNDEKYKNWQPNLKIPRTPDFDEPDMLDKPSHRQSPPYSAEELATLHFEHQCRARAVKSVDDFVQRMIKELKAKGMYENTWFMITSDNGYQLGHHRLMSKLDPYRMSTTAPLFVSGPEVKEPCKADHLLAHIDMCPTILDLAKCPKPDFLDGKSFVDLVRDPKSHAEDSWRKPVVLENWQVKRNRRIFLPGMYSGLRYHDKLYVEWCSGEREYYDLATDPYELDNAYDSLSESEKEELRDDLFAARSVKMDPIVTVMHRPILTDHRKFPFCVRGMAEDDRCIKRIKVMIRHMQHGFWNGQSWQRSRTHVETTDFPSDQQMVSWQYDIRQAVSHLTEKDSIVVDDRKVFRVVLQAFAWDGDGNQSEEARTQMFVPFTTDPYEENRTADAKQTTAVR